MMDDPLETSLKEIAPQLEDGMSPLIVALQAGQSIEEAWEKVLQEILDEA